MGNGYKFANKAAQSVPIGILCTDGTPYYLPTIVNKIVDHIY